MSHEAIERPEETPEEIPQASADTPPEVVHRPPVKEGAAEIFETGKTFKDLGLRDSVLKGIEAAGFKYPTGIQAALIPSILTGRDVIGQAKTGTGKTAAFGLPLLHMVKRDVPFQALILAPTRELAIQITAEIQELGKGTPIRVMTVYGGQAVRTQAQKLEKGAEIIVGTPGRVMDMVERGHLHFRNVAFAVLDEVDRMLDIGFREDIRQILEKCPEARQTVFVSATLSPEIEKLARRYLKNPEKVVVTGGSLTVSLVKQYHLPVYPWDKRRLLLHLLKHEEPALTLIFCRLKRTVDELTKLLNAKGIEAHALHGDMSQGKRNTTMKLLREGDLSVLISSDLTSRGIDVEGISHVINYDLPEDVELYVHRIGRTARAGRGGTAWSLVTPEQGELLTQIEMLINTEIPKLDYPDFKPSAPPSDWRGELPKGMVREGKPREGGAEKAGGAAGPGGTGPGGVGEGAAGAEAEKVSRLTRAAAPELPKAADPTKFPGGVVPTKLPPRRMFGRIPGGRH